MLNHNNNNRIDGLDLYHAFKNGTEELSHSVEEINKINVFPVQDSDTGTNLYATVKSILDDTFWSNDLKRTIKNISSSAVTNAKGNSGSILALYLRGFEKAMVAYSELTLSTLADALGSAYLYVHRSMNNPQEGTIITLMRVWSEYLREISRSHSVTLKEALLSSIPILRQCLEETKAQLDILSKVNVVDAGALGFVCLIEGMLKPYKKGRSRRYLPSKNMVLNDLHDITASVFRYCYEVNVKSQNLSDEMIRKQLEQWGNSVICMSDGELLHVHIHTDSPMVISNYLSSKGKIEKVKVDDLKQQYYFSQLEKEPIALVVDSACDLPKEIIDRYHIYQIALPMEINGNQHLDSLTINGDILYDDMKHQGATCYSSQVGQGMFESYYQWLLEKYDHVISLHITRNFSGTFDNALRAAKEVDGKSHPHIDVWDSATLSSAYGMIVEALAKQIEERKSIDFLRSFFESYRSKVDIWVSVRSLDAMVKSGRVSSKVHYWVDILGIHPVISMNNDGKAAFGGVAFGFHRCLKKIVRKVSYRKVKRFQVVHVDASYDAQRLEKQLSDKLKINFLPSRSVTPVIGVYAGLGAVGVAVEYE